MSEAERRLFAVLGDPVAHSRSPAMHGAAFAALGLPHVYVSRRVVRADLGAALHGAAVLGFSGLNLTVPHKEAALPHLHEIDPLAARIGAVNTVAIAQGRLVGYNTDAPGFLDALGELGGPEPTRAVVLGGGGAARAIVAALVQVGSGSIEVAWVSRRPGTLPAWDGVVPTDWASLVGACRGADLIVHATTFGMPGGIAALPAAIPWDALGPDARAVDIVVPGRPGGFADAARRAGLPSQDGAPMLLWQGVRALAIWLGRDIPPPVVAAMRAAIA